MTEYLRSTKEAEIIQFDRFESQINFAPEIIQKQKTTGCASDVYSLGVILFYLLLGYYPFKKATIEDEQYKTMMCNRSDIFYLRKRRQYVFPDETKVILDALFELREL